MSQKTLHAASSLDRMLSFVHGVDACNEPRMVLDLLNEASRQLDLNVLGAALLPIRWGDWRALERGKTVFLHSSAPNGWWEHWLELTKQHPGPGLTAMSSAISPTTMSELMRYFEPLGVDRWPFELALKYGMRDQFVCPVGGRWVVIFWSRKVLADRLAPETRAVLAMGATCAAIRLQKLVGLNIPRVGELASLTPRERCVLRLISLGYPMSEAALALELGEETVRTHLKKAQEKLGTRNRAHSVAQAIRLRLIT